MKTQTLIDDAAAPDRLPRPSLRPSWKMSWMRLQGQLMQGRRDAGLSQDDVADALGVSRSTVWRWETGRTIPDAYQLFRWAELLDIEITSAKCVTNDAPVPA